VGGFSGVFAVGVVWFSGLGLDQYDECGEADEAACEALRDGVEVVEGVGAVFGVGVVLPDEVAVADDDEAVYGDGVDPDVVVHLLQVLGRHALCLGG